MLAIVRLLIYLILEMCSFVMTIIFVLMVLLVTMLVYTTIIITILFDFNTIYRYAHHTYLVYGCYLGHYMSHPTCKSLSG